MTKRGLAKHQLQESCFLSIRILQVQGLAVALGVIETDLRDHYNIYFTPVSSTSKAFEHLRARGTGRSEPVLRFESERELGTRHS